RDHVSDQHLRNAVAEGLHGRLQLHLHVHGDLRLLEKHIIQNHPGHVPEDHVVDVGLDLSFGVRQLVEGVLHAIRNDEVLHVDRNLYEDIVLRLGLDNGRELLDAQVDHGDDAVDPGRFEVQACISDAQELSKALDDGCLLRLDGEEAAQQCGQYQQREKTADNDNRNSRYVHSLLLPTYEDCHW